MLRIFISLAFSMLLNDVSGQINFLETDIPEAHKQLIVVTTSDWNEVSGSMIRYEKVGGDWIKVGDIVPVVVGKNGMAWGTGTHMNVDASNQKKEGDGKAPAGAFNLSTAFGYSETTKLDAGFPYRLATDRDYYVDDIESLDYNTWVSIGNEEPNEPKGKWKSFERMRRNDSLYEFGIVVRHNKTPIVAGNGSAIFIHVWRDETSPTLGCTAMDKSNLLELMNWLDPIKKPLLVQAPRKELAMISFK